MRALISVVFVFFFVAQALAAPAPAPVSSDKSPSDKTGAPGANVEMPFLMAPTHGQRRQIVGLCLYLHPADRDIRRRALDVRDKIAFIQDAFVRDVNGAGVAKPTDPGTVDNSALEARLLADARRVMGPGKVASIAIVQLQIAPLHPDSSQTPATPRRRARRFADDKPAKAPKAAEAAAK